MMKPSISAQNLSKVFGHVKAVDQVSFDVAHGELFGLIGPDGAGKTTLFKMLTSLLIPDKGEAFVEDFHTVNHYKEVRKIIGYMPGKFSLYQDLTVEENLNFFATIFSTTIKENYHLIEDIYVQIEPFKNRRAGKLSGGMKQKLALCCALIHEPQVLFLDEPTTGVDAVSRAEFWTMLKRLKDKGITILVSTPYMDEAILCEKIALIQAGTILQIDTPDNIIQNHNKQILAVRAQEFYRLLKALRQEDFSERVEPFGEYLHLSTTRNIGVEALTSRLEAQGFSEVEVKPQIATIEDVFLDLMKAEEV